LRQFVKVDRTVWACQVKIAYDFHYVRDIRFGVRKVGAVAKLARHDATGSGSSHQDQEQPHKSKESSIGVS
jgi:hypothetical protein